MVMQVTQKTHFHSDDFEIVDEHIRTKVKRESVETYELSWGKDAQAWADDRLGRRNYRVRNGFGIIHLDFKTNKDFSSSTEYTIATLPANAPIPDELCETMVYTNGKPAGVWIEKHSRTIKSSGLAQNTRYIVNLPVFTI